MELMVAASRRVSIHNSAQKADSALPGACFSP
jgi:hypothetical protein